MPVGNSSEDAGKNGRSRSKPALAERVYHMLYARISNGDYPTNSKLPPELHLSEEFGVSRPVLRTALERLRSEGLVYSRQGAGSYVRAPQGHALGFAKVETIADIQRCYEFRINLETEAAGLAAERRSEDDVAAMEGALRLMDAATLSHQHREDADFAFHLAVTTATGNHYFEASMRALREHIAVGMKMHGKSLMSDGPKGLHEVFNEHSAIFAAIRDRDSDAARRLMHDHLVHSRERLFGGSLLDLRRG
ncbi:FadR/GntR family transcriptional regulator [Mesorhizobium sp. RMAD-H1]|uniref:FadR/GntR family transcriptional regulator n=1 Tax=Mesorhizobium sp. RMAD-H1 TaxID=2587065 RepID=UPI00161DC613|nr:FadR/GntR family transcriptional regulator [Mesorhizobium sp. RMAD-H1]MBB2974162.1 GntR family transcriptional repressor for pyruvate dehydrogenase complex [Mesorhizobium sp. RMAD-H1]